MKSLTINSQSRIDFNKKTTIMGILNVTPDSFSDGGKFNRLDDAVERAKSLVADGAGIIDIGGESTRPGHDPVPCEEESERVVPVIERLAETIDTPISIDTFKAKTAENALQAGATIINDVWGAKADPEITAVAKSFNAPIVLMHNQDEPIYDDIIEDMKKSLSESIEIAKKNGVSEDKIIIDPGIGFGKTLEQNLLVMRRLSELKAMGYPILLGTSRKSMIGKVLDLPVEERLEGTIATVCSGIQQGVEIVRVHDVKEVNRAVQMMDAMLGKGGVSFG
ncbi:dihydropteroate synthase [Allobacillus sp. GCM10007491]|uniref:Dihydropteroate synthase n=1 Tax=Allobacillus saliphilus TaxID=2912308 RepID=A0A941HTY3_9BACI|nr:dihydropteroate synthase [Allobacillus saliphilus]MBR7554320.1 dihydropteroate synthase [Allobacillus saliphilus]